MKFGSIAMCIVIFLLWWLMKWLPIKNRQFWNKGMSFKVWSQNFSTCYVIVLWNVNACQAGSCVEVDLDFWPLARKKTYDLKKRTSMRKRLHIQGGWKNWPKMFPKCLANFSNAWPIFPTCGQFFQLLANNFLAEIIFSIDWISQKLDCLVRWRCKIHTYDS